MPIRGEAYRSKRREPGLGRAPPPAGGSSKSETLASELPGWQAGPE